MLTFNGFYFVVGRSEELLEQVVAGAHIADSYTDVVNSDHEWWSGDWWSGDWWSGDWLVVIGGVVIG